jgi:hypothetical protein
VPLPEPIQQGYSVTEPSLAMHPTFVRSMPKVADVGKHGEASVDAYIYIPLGALIEKDVASLFSQQDGVEFGRDEESEVHQLA